MTDAHLFAIGVLLAWLAGRADPQEAPRLDPWG